MKRGERFQETPLERKLLNQERLEMLLLKEDFRVFLIKRGVKRVVLDNPQYSELPNVCGCFAKDGQWIVYETDDRAQVAVEERFSSAELAYSALAARLGYLYEPKFDYCEMLEKETDEAFTILRYLLEKAMERLGAIASSLSETEARSAIEDDIRFLMIASLNLENNQNARWRDELIVQVNFLTKQNEEMKSRIQANERAVQNLLRGRVASPHL